MITPKVAMPASRFISPPDEGRKKEPFMPPALTGFVSRFMQRIAEAPSLGSRFLQPLTRIIKPSPRRLRSLWKSKHFRKPFS